MKIHPVCFVMPAQTGEQRAKLAADLQRHGCLDAVWVWRGQVYDGRTRVELCEEHGIAFETREIPAETEEEAIQFAWDQQTTRRNLTTEEKAFAALELEKVLTVAAKARQEEGVRGKNTPKGKAINQAAEMM